ncbi:MAG: pilin [Candidatus Paceibacterota bacterium]
MRSRTSLFTLFFAVSVLALPVAAHASIPFFGPVIPAAYNVCPASWGLLLTVVNNVIELLITLAIVFVAPIMIAYSGFLFVVNPVNASGKEQAKKILTNTIVGIVVALAGWMIVDAIMVVLYNPGAESGSTRLETWSNIIGSKGIEPCLPQKGALPGDDLNQSVSTGVSADGGKFLALPSNGNCTPSNLMAATAGSQYALTQSQANTLSCIAIPESSCGNNVSQARQPDGTPTSASGMFQIVFGSGNDTCHNLNIPACSEAAKVNGPLNCYSAFRGGLPRAGKEAEAAACKRAAANLNCNAQAAGCLVKGRNGGFGDWTADPRASTQKNCVTQYANK